MRNHFLTSGKQVFCEMCFALLCADTRCFALVRKGAGEVFDPQEQEKVAAEIETFLKVSCLDIIYWWVAFNQYLCEYLGC